MLLYNLKFFNKINKRAFFKHPGKKLKNLISAKGAYPNRYGNPIAKSSDDTVEHPL